MELTVKKRTDAVKKLRRKGMIPAILYGVGNIEIDLGEFAKILRSIKKGCLATTVFTLKMDGESIQAVVKEIQYHRTTYDIIHLDFLKLNPGEPVRINVPIFLSGIADCVGVKQGGAPRLIINRLAVSCPPDVIPQEFILDVQELSIGGTKRLRDIVLPEKVKAHGKMDEVAAVIAKG